MTVNIVDKVASEQQIRPLQVQSVVSLLDEGATIPFIARYRKEKTGSLDEVAIAAIRDRVEQLRELDKRRETIIKSLEKQEKLTPELQKAVAEADTMAVLEDIYLPYKPKRKTRGSTAKEKGLEPLAQLIWEQGPLDLLGEAAVYVDQEKGVASVEDALQGARDIMAEWVNEDKAAREQMRRLFIKEATIKSKVLKGKEDEAQKYKDYFEWEEPVSSVPSHRLLAMRRGEKEMFLALDIHPDEDTAIRRLESMFVRLEGKSGSQIKLAIADSFKRLLKPSMETEVRLLTKTQADKEAIRVFAENLKQLLMAPPIGQKRVLAIDPGFRTGCKVVCLDRQGKLSANTTIYPNEPQKELVKATAEIRHLCEEHNIEAIAIGNGTASRETETFVKSIDLPGSVPVVMVNESGASVYSASEVAREEFPDYDVTVRGAVSIGRRLVDPLSELVKIDPKSIGVGQYQHDVDQNALKNSLDDVVMSCVNAVGVEINTASKELLSYVSGLGPQLAKSIVHYRNENGPFKDRESLKIVPRLGEKVFEQAAGFLRIRNAANPLDASSVHPESYHIVEKMAKDQACTVLELINQQGLQKNIALDKYITSERGLPTLKDIMAELAKPGRDPREKFELFSFQEGVNRIEDLKIGMELPGIVTNITNFGAFVDVGVHQDGLVHISHMSDQFVKNPAELVSVQQKVQVTVVEVDLNRNRIALSMKSDPFGTKSARSKKTNQAQSGDLQQKLGELKNKFR